MGLSLSEYGITDINTGRLEKFLDEESFYARLGMECPPPEIREGGREIALAEKHVLPHLIEQSDIKGDFHTHTDESDGRASLADMAQAAKDRGYQYIGISDHSMGLGIAHGLDVERTRAQICQIKALNQTAGIRIFVA